MFKYLAVIKDSLREAMASRVLWLVLALITILLVAVAPLGYREELTFRLRDADVREWPKLMDEVRKVRDDPKLTPTRHLWNLLDEDLQKTMATVRIPGIDQDAANPFEFIGALRDFQDAMNDMLKLREFYDPEVFANVSLNSSELRELRDEGLDNLDELELARFNRLLIEAAFPEMVRSSPPTSIQLEYGWMDFGASYPLRGETLRESLQSSAVWASNWFVGVIGVFVAILVTAPIIPQMFDSGSLHLLLSKPVSRSLLFLSKYLGGCIFILISAAYLIGGLWLILGLRFEVWEPKLLLSIPIYLFIFAIYYAVAAFVGIVWRSAIVSIALTILFWLLCFVIGVSKNTFEVTIWNKARLVKVFEASESLLAVNEMGFTQEWDPSDRRWKEVFANSDQRQSRAVLFFMPMVPQEFRSVGPVYDEQRDQLISVQPTFPPNSLKIYVGKREEEWEPDSNLSAPAGTVGVFKTESGEILIVSRMGIYRMAADPGERQEPLKLFGFNIPLNIGGAMERIGPEPPVLLTRPVAVDYDPQSQHLVLYSRGTITTLRMDESTGRFQRIHEKQLDGEEREPVLLTVQGDELWIGREDGRLELFDLQEWKQLNQWQPEGKNQPRFLTASPEGRWFATVFHNGKLWLYDRQEKELLQPEVDGQGDISSVDFPQSDAMLVADWTIRVTRYQLPSFDVDKRFTPKLTLLETAYRYGLVPLYTVFPKPGELDDTIEYLLSGRETETFDRDDLSSAQQIIDPWAPVWSSAIFTLVMLLLACVYIERQDF